MQAMGALDTCLPPWLAQETTISEMRQDGEQRDRTTDSLGITAPEDRLKMRPDIVIVDLATNDLNKIESRMPKTRKANGEQVTLKDMIGRKRITILEIGYVTDTRYEDRYKAKVQQHRTLCQILGKEGHEVKLYPNILGTQGSVLNCFKAAMSAVGIQGLQQMALAGKLHDHAVTSLSKIIRLRRFFDVHRVGQCQVCVTLACKGLTLVSERDDGRTCMPTGFNWTSSLLFLAAGGTFRLQIPLSR